MLNDHGTETFAPVASVTVIVDANLPAVVAAPVTRAGRRIERDARRERAGGRERVRRPAADRLHAGRRAAR